MQKQLKILSMEPIPRWYGLSWDELAVAIRIWVHPEFAHALQPIADDAPITANLRHGLDFRAFQGSFGDTRFGFESALRLDHRPDGSLEFLAKLPKVRFPTSKRCGECQGAVRVGKRQRERCYYCGGTGREHQYRWHRADAVSASLAVLLAALEYPESETSDPRPQLLTVHGFPTTGGYSAGGMVGIPLAKMLRGYPEGTEFRGVEAAMRAAYRQMVGPAHAEQRGFRACLYDKDGSLSLDCPGATTFGGHDRFPGSHGYEFASRDIHVPEQQLALFAGLAALHDFADRHVPAAAPAASAG